MKRSRLIPPNNVNVWVNRQGALKTHMLLKSATQKDVTNAVSLEKEDKLTVR